MAQLECPEEVQATTAGARRYQRRPESTTLYEIVPDNLETRAETRAWTTRCPLATEPNPSYPKASRRCAGAVLSGEAMLMQFVVENFLSFRDKAVLSMVAVEGVDHSDHHCLRVAGLPPILKCAAVYGANASGKSNLMKALYFAQSFIVNGTKSGDKIKVSPFKLDEASSAAASRFEFEVFCAGRRYSYGFAATTEAIEAEWLYVTEGTEEQLLFERNRGEEQAEQPEITLGDALAAEPTRKQFLGFVAQGTRPNQLFLTEANERNVAEIRPLMAWFSSRLGVVFPDSRAKQLAYRAEQEPGLKEFIGDVLKSAGTGVSGITIEQTEIDMPMSDLLEGAEQPPIGGITGRRLIEEDLVVDDDGSNARLLKIKAQHLSRSGAFVPFDLKEESDGTRRLIHLAPVLYRLQKPTAESERVYAIDELDRSLHPILTRSFVKTFLESSAPDSQCQLLFTTHDTNLLDLHVLSRDSIWFTEKDGSGASSLYSLSEFKDEQLDKLGDRIEEGYLQGRFGAVPFLADPRRLGWTKAGEK